MIWMFLVGYSLGYLVCTFVRILEHRYNTEWYWIPTWTRNMNGERLFRWGVLVKWKVGM